MIVKVIQGLAFKAGLSIWIFDREEDLPKWIREEIDSKKWERMEMSDCIRYHSPSVIAFWQHLRLHPHIKWKTEKTFKGKNAQRPSKHTVPDRVQGRILLERAVAEEERPGA